MRISMFVARRVLGTAAVVLFFGIAAMPPAKAADVAGALSGATSITVESSTSTFSSSLAAADAVDATLARKIALMEARRTWGPGALRDAILAYDLDGSPSAYIFMYKKGAASFPTDEEVLREISDVDAPLAAARQALAQAREDAFNSGQVKVIQRGGQATTVKPEKWAAADQAVRRLEDKRGGVGVYGTLVISATKSRAPILKGINGLHSYFTRRVETQGEAAKALGAPPVRISRVIFSPPEDESFEFEANGNRVTIGVSPVRRLEASQLTRRQESALSGPAASQARRAQQDWVVEKWREVEQSLEVNR